MLNYQPIISQRRYGDYLMLLTIAHNPHAEEPEALFETLKELTGTSYVDVIEPDRQSLKDLQGLISPNMQK